MPRLTQAEYAALLARQSRALTPLPSESFAVESREAVLHEQIFAACRLRGWIALHGSTAHRTRRTIGEPDFVILADGGRVFLVECKRGAGKPSVEQAGLIAWAQKLGHEVHVIRSLAEFESLIQGIAPLPLPVHAHD